MTIHPTAIIEKGAILEQGVSIEPYAIIKQHVHLGERVCVKAHAYIDGYTAIGADSVIWPGAVVGAKTQDLKYRGEVTYVRIGQRCHIRECATINSSTGEGDVVEIGDDCLIMAYCHVAHNCKVGRHVIMSNAATLAGHVTLGDYAIIGGMTPIHQHTRVGAYAMVGGMSRVNYDIPPFTIGAGVPYRLAGINIVGLKRHGFSLEDRLMMTRAFKVTYRSNLRLEEAIEQLLRDYGESPWIRQWVDFCQSSKRGLIQLTSNSKE